jgi:outer membrane lipoprotein SlyB
MDVGASDGVPLGRIVGEQLGTVLGMDVGASDGALLGRLVGELLGSVLGMDIGSIEGQDDGIAVELDV